MVLVCLVLPIALFSQSGSITNIQVSQRTDGSGNVDVYYNLTGPAPNYFVSMEVSFNNGSTFTAISPTFLTGTSGIAPGTNRHLRWNGKGSNNNTYSVQTKVKLIASTSWSCGQPFTDSRDGKTYNTVQIGTQCWMAQNLNIGIKINGIQEQTNNSGIEKYCYNDLESNCGIYGGLYQWAEMVQYLNGATNTTSWIPVPTGNIQGICPTGWHIPTDTEWTTVNTFLGGDSVAGGKMKSTGTIEAGTGLWHSPNTGATNESGFTAVPAGIFFYHGMFGLVDSYGYWWSSSEGVPSNAWGWFLYCDGSSVYGGSYPRSYGFSVRCLRDL